MKIPFIAIFTETRTAGVPPAGSAVISTAVPTPIPGRDAVTAALLVVFANRDAQTLDDVDGTKVNLGGQGEGVHTREIDFLREIPETWDRHRICTATAIAAENWWATPPIVCSSPPTSSPAPAQRAGPQEWLRWVKNHVVVQS